MLLHEVQLVAEEKERDAWKSFDTFLYASKTGTPKAPWHAKIYSSAIFFWRSRRWRKTERPCEKLQKGSRWLAVEIPGRRVDFPSPSLRDGRSLAQQLLRFHIPSCPLRAYNKKFRAMLRTRYLHKPQCLNFTKELVNTMSSSSIKPDLLFKKLLVLNELFSIMSSSSII